MEIMQLRWKAVLRNMQVYCVGGVCAFVYHTIDNVQHVCHLSCITEHIFNKIILVINYCITIIKSYNIIKGYAPLRNIEYVYVLIMYNVETYTTSKIHMLQ